MRTTLFWAITQRVVIIYYRRFGTETSARSYYYMLRNDPENRSSHSSTTCQCSTGFGSCVYFFLLQRFCVTALCCVVSLVVVYERLPFLSTSISRPVLWFPCDLTFSRLMTYIYVVPHRYPPDVAFYIFIQQIYVLNILNMLHTPRSFFFKIPFIS
jgi:hypothetical protein